jgi:hypothetical protein
MLDAARGAADTGRATSRENVEIVRRFLVVDDLDEALMEVDPDIVWNPVEESSAEGHDAVRASTARWTGEWDHYELIPEGFADAGDRVVATVRFRARGRGSGIRSTPASTTFLRSATARSCAWISSPSSPKPSQP